MKTLPTPATQTVFSAGVLPFFEPDPGQALPRIERCTRAGPVLHACPMGDPEEVMSLNLAAGCVHRCAFCSVRAAPRYHGDQVVRLYADTAHRLAAELAARRQKPRAVYVSPSTDPFPPSAEFQAETVRAVETLAENGVKALLLTRGYVRPFALRRLAGSRGHVRVTVALTTLDRGLQRVLEPLAAPPRLRIRQIAGLTREGIPVQAALEPLVAGWTDTRSNLASLLEALAGAGVQRVTAGYLFLRPGIRANLVRAFDGAGLDPRLLDAYESGPTLRGEGVCVARYLPRRQRQRGYAALMALAAEFGISVRVCGITNPDFPAPRPSPGPLLPALPLAFSSAR
jgi:DNA repair photolyase